MCLFWKWKFMDLKIAENLLIIRRIFLRFLFLRLLVIFFPSDCICFSDHSFLPFILFSYVILIKLNILSGKNGKKMNFSASIIELYKCFCFSFSKHVCDFSVFLRSITSYEQGNYITQIFNDFSLSEYSN